MKRRDFFTKTTGAVIATGLSPVIGNGNAADAEIPMEKSTGQITDRKKELTFEVAVIGGGMSGISAAVASARTGAKTVLIQDRPVLGGNASSEMRVTVNGVHGLKNKHRVERETGIIEEILIENWHFNPQESYPVWDHVLYDYVTRQENLELMLNISAKEAVMDGDKIKSIVGWQSTTETEYTINANIFIDCSGDGLVAVKAGAEFRMGREAKSEFDESFAPEKSDGWVMGDTIMLITKDMGKPTPYYPPSYVLKFDAAKAHKRKIKNYKEGYWWVELGSDVDVIAMREKNRHKLMGYLHGVWDYIKNSGDHPGSANMALDWIGSIPGRRESRRFMGDYILNQKDMETYQHFDDAIAFGGWSLDEHCPGGIENLSDPPSYFHSNFKQVYEIPFRCLYSKNISNLLFAGRNVSVSHIALSSTRIIATCAMMGQASGTAAAMCIQKNISPRHLGKNHIKSLQEQLLRDDVYIPNRPAKDDNDLARKSNVIIASSTSSGDVKLLTDGTGRDEVDKIHHWQSDGLNAELQMEWNKPVQLSRIELKANTNLQRKINMHKNPAKNEKQLLVVPPELIKTLSVEVREKGKWRTVASVENNMTRQIKIQFDEVKTTAVRLNLKETWGDKNIRLYEVRAYA